MLFKQWEVCGQSLMSWGEATVEASYSYLVRPPTKPSHEH